jgi:hypothetical protein
MRERPRHLAESPEAKYDQLLQQGIAVQKKYESLRKRIRNAGKEGRDDKAEELRGQKAQLANSVSHLLLQRTELVRTLEKLQTIEDAFPRVRRQTKEEKKTVDAAMLAEMFDTGECTDALEELADQAQANAPEELSDEEIAAFAKARATLALELGYEKASPEEGGFDLERNGVRISMGHFPFRSSFGITGDDRISKIGVFVKNGTSDMRVMHYDRGWDVACTDPIVQKEIDRAIAIFG